MTTTTITAVEQTSADEPLTELGRYFALVAAAAATGSDTWLPMFSPAVDAAWHDLTRDPAVLTAFCDDHAGVQIGHMPARGHGHIPWVAQYEARFGQLPQIWFTRADGSLDSAALGAYQRTGVVVTDWDCGPVLPDSDPEEGVEVPPAPTHTAPHPQQKPLPGYGE